MWQRFTERARRVVFFAQEEAGKLGENYVSTEHLLLGLVREDDSVAARVLHRLHLSLPRIRAEVMRQIAPGDGRQAQDMQLTPRAKRVIDLAYEQARQLNNNYIGTEHMLLGLILEGEGIAGRILQSFGIEFEEALAEVTELQDAAADEQAAKDNVALEKTLAKVPGPLRERLRALIPKSEPNRSYREETQPMLSFGDLGKIAPTEGRTHAEVALDLTAFLRLQDVFAAKDAHGYRAMADGDQTMFLLPAGTRLKLLAPPPDSKAAHDDGFYIRVLSGEYEGYAGWIFKEAFERTGADDAPFPPTREDHPLAR